MIELHTRVGQIRRGPNGAGHIVSLYCKDTGRSTQWKCDAVAVCTGINVNPVIPEIKGVERVPSVLHSSQLKTRARFGEGTNVYIMGAGETGMDLAYLAVTSKAKSVTLCHRDGFFCAPKVHSHLLYSSRNSLNTRCRSSPFPESWVAQRRIPVVARTSRLTHP